jgi:apolipoprotein N-acyltransferase
MLPFLLPPIAAMLQTWRNRPLAMGFASALIIVGVVVYTLSSATFPYWPDRFHHPLYEVTFRLIGEDLVAPNLGSAIGIGGVLGIVPYVALVSALLAGTIHQIAGWRGLILATIIASTILTGYGLFAHGGPEADQPYSFVRAAVIES